LGLSLLLIGFMFFAVRQSRVIRSQRDRIQEVLDNIEEGILRFGKDFKINQDYSAHVSQILGISQDLTGHDLFEILFARAELGADVQATIRAALSHILDEDELAWSLNSNQLPTELQRQGCILNLLWQPHYNSQGKIDKMLLVMKDVTISKALEAEVQASRQQSRTMTSFVQELLQANGRSLDHFMLDLPKRLTPLTITRHDPEERALALRQLHTLKGNARTLGLMELAEAVHQVESSQLQDPLLTSALAHLHAVGQQYDQLFQSMFRGHSQTSSTLLTLVDDIQPGIKQLLEKNHQPWGSITVKDEVGVWPADWQESLRVLLLHGLSNAVDHGYVLPHNPDAVRLAVEARRLPQGIRIYIRDRGCGIQ
ncbi:MAG: Hpt domain-containing protein, partial [Pseudobdellovibrionaceae bacterium]|nr:Hpt domain-containing protein [Pseudobdellovibrionaceae bacterium]